MIVPLESIHLAKHRMSLGIGAERQETRAVSGVAGCRKPGADLKGTILEVLDVSSPKGLLQELITTSLNGTEKLVRGLRVNLVFVKGIEGNNDERIDEEQPRT